jgi:endonuclease/exonuclease/phosphatase family metal-dependent hydrolase
MTYNIHNCLGIDGKLSPRRIARVIARYRPDVVALQEVDLGRARTEWADQAKIIAEHLRMEHHFHPTIQVQEEAYGDCILSRLPMRLVKTGMLPTLPDRDKLERRGAIWVEVEWNGTTVHLVNTHLGLYARERLRQVETLLGDEWLGGLDDRARIALCGDFNAIPQSRVWRRCTEVLRDAQSSSGGPPRRTWFGRFPLARIDHIFINADLEVAGVEVGDDDLARIASDHRPVVASLRLRS